MHNNSAHHLLTDASPSLSSSSQLLTIPGLNTGHNIYGVKYPCLGSLTHLTWTCSLRISCVAPHWQSVRHLRSPWFRVNTTWHTDVFVVAINIILILDPKHSIVSATGKKSNYIRAKPRAIIKLFFLLNFMIEFQFIWVAILFVQFFWITISSEITPYFCNSMHARHLNCIVLLELKSTCLCTNWKN